MTGEHILEILMLKKKMGTEAVTSAICHEPITKEKCRYTNTQEFGGVINGGRNGQGGWGRMEQIRTKHVPIPHSGETQTHEGMDEIMGPKKTSTQQKKKNGKREGYSQEGMMTFRLAGRWAEGEAQRTKEKGNCPAKGLDQKRYLLKKKHGTKDTKYRGGF